MPEPQTNGWRPSHSGIHHTLHRYAEAGSALDHLWLWESHSKDFHYVLGKIAFLLVVFAALHSEQWAPAIWNLCTNCGLWLWWNAQAVSDRPIRNLPRLEGQHGSTVCSFSHCFVTPSVNRAFSLFLGGEKGKCNWTQCKNCQGVPGEELHGWSHCWGQRDHQAGYQGSAGGKISLKISIKHFKPFVRAQTSLSWMTEVAEPSELQKGV